MGLAEPAAGSERLGEDLLERGAARATWRSVSLKTSGSEMASIAESICSSLYGPRATGGPYSDFRRSHICSSP